MDVNIDQVLTVRSERYNGRKEARIERYENLAAKHKAKSQAAYTRSSEMASIIPFGQPILVGHHSEKRDRNYREKIGNAMRASVEHEKTAEYYNNKADAAAINTAISSDDPTAVQQLKEKIASLQTKQDAMKAINKIIKSKKLTDLQKIEQAKALGECPSRLVADSWGYVGYAHFELTNNNAKLKSAKARLESLEKSLVVAATVGNTTEKYSWGEVIHNREINRLQLVFPGKPSQETRALLKRQGFKWSPSEGAWQRNLGSHAWALKAILEALECA